MIEVSVPLQLVQDALGRLDELRQCTQMHMEQEEDSQEYDEDSDQHDKQARGENACEGMHYRFLSGTREQDVSMKKQQSFCLLCFSGAVRENKSQAVVFHHFAIEPS